MRERHAQEQQGKNGTGMHHDAQQQRSESGTAAAMRGAAWQQRGELPRLYLGYTSDILRLYFGYTSDILWIYLRGISTRAPGLVGYLLHTQPPGVLGVSERHSSDAYRHSDSTQCLNCRGFPSVAGVSACLTFTCTLQCVCVCVFAPACLHAGVGVCSS